MHPVSFPSLDTATSLELWLDFQIRFSEVQPLMLKFLANEIFSESRHSYSCLKIFASESSGSLLNIQRSVKVLLQWLQNNRSTLRDEMVCRTLVIITRMARRRGYPQISDQQF